MAKDNKYHIHLRGTVGYWRFDAEYVEYMLNKYKNEQVDVLINSLGGDVGAALTISAAFRRHGNVHVHYEAMNASAATIASLGAKHVTIDHDSLYMVHKCSRVVFVWDQLNADQMQDLIDQYEKVKNDLNKIDLQIAKSYADRCKKDSKALLQVMKEGAWLTAQEALEWGFVDEVTDNPEDEKPHFTAQVKDFLASEGIPMPNLPLEEEGQGEEDAGWLARLKEFLRKQYGQITNQQTDEKIKMKKTFMFIAAVLALQAFECEEGGKIEMTCDQLKALDDRLKALNDQAEADKATIAQHTAAIDDFKAQLTAKTDELAAKTTELNAKTAELTALQKQPAGESKQVTENNNAGEGEESPMAQYYKDREEAQQMIDTLHGKS